MLTPIFQNFPSELKFHPNWVLWKGKKVPFNPVALNSTASVSDYDSWGTFDQVQTAFEEGGWLGVGFVLTGNGIAGIDLDNCVVDGKPEPKAIELLTKLDASYIELSPSGNGLRAFGFADNLKSGARGNLNGLAVELYTDHRYLTITGHVLLNKPLNKLRHFDVLAESIRNRPTEDTEAIEELLSVTSVSSVGTGLIYPINTIPKSNGKRNTAIFNLARWLKGIEPDASYERQKEIVKEWHALHHNVIGTKAFSISWVDFRNAWDSVEIPYGAIFRQCLANLPSPPQSERLIDYGSRAILLFQICMALQAHHGTAPFFLSARIAGKEIGCHFTDAAALLKLFVKEGWLELVTRGVNMKASRYRLSFIENA